MVLFLMLWTSSLRGRDAEPLLLHVCGEVVFCVAVMTYEQLQGRSPQGILTDRRHSHKNAAAVLLVASYLTFF